MPALHLGYIEEVMAENSTGNSRKVSIKRRSGWNRFYQEVAVCFGFLFLVYCEINWLEPFPNSAL